MPYEKNKFLGNLKPTSFIFLMCSSLLASNIINVTPARSAIVSIGDNQSQNSTGNDTVTFTGANGDNTSGQYVVVVSPTVQIDSLFINNDGNGNIILNGASTDVFFNNVVNGNALNSITQTAGTTTLNNTNDVVVNNLNISGGSLTLFSPLDVLNAATFSNSTTSLEGQINLAGNMTINSGGAVTMTENLNMNGGVNQIITINSGGVFDFRATISGADVDVNVNGGTLQAGGSSTISNMNITGNVNFAGGGILRNNITAAGNSDLVNVTGTATLTGGTVQVAADAGGTYAASTDYTILTATNIVGTYSNVTSNLAFLTPILTYDANNVFLHMVRNDLSYDDITNTPNQSAIGTTITQLIQSDPATFGSVTATINGLSAEAARQAFDSLSGAQHTTNNNVILNVNNQFNQLLFGRIGFGSSQGIANQSANAPALFAFHNYGASVHAEAMAQAAEIAALTSPAAGSETKNERGTWIKAIGGFGTIDGDSSAAGADYDTIGIAFGADKDWENYVFGVAGSYARTDVDGFRSNTDTDSYQVAVYGGWDNGTIYANGNLGIGYHHSDASRLVELGATTQVASADYDAISYSASTEIGKPIIYNSKTHITPYVGLDYNNLNRDDFTETGAGVSNLTLGEETEQSLRSRLGLRASHKLKNENGMNLTPYAYGGYVHEFLDNESSLTAGFAAAPTTTFTVDGPELNRDRLEMGFGISGRLDDNKTFNLGYDGNIASTDSNHTFTAAFKYSF